jgi:hypothetical protein
MAPSMPAMLHLLKRLGLFLAIGGVLGDVVTMMIAPGMLTWFQTPGTGSALCNCVDVSRQTATSLVHAQLAGTCIGAVSLAVVGELLWRLWDARRHRKEIAAAASSSSSSSAAPPPAQVPAQTETPVTTATPPPT